MASSWVVTVLCSFWLGNLSALSFSYMCINIYILYAICGTPHWFIHLVPLWKLSFICGCENLVPVGNFLWMWRGLICQLSFRWTEERVVNLSSDRWKNRWRKKAPYTKQNLQTGLSRWDHIWFGLQNVSYNLYHQQLHSKGSVEPNLSKYIISALIASNPTYHFSFMCCGFTFPV